MRFQAAFHRKLSNNTYYLLLSKITVKTLENDFLLIPKRNLFSAVASQKLTKLNF